MTLQREAAFSLSIIILVAWAKPIRREMAGYKSGFRHKVLCS